MQYVKPCPREVYYALGAQRLLRVGMTDHCRPRSEDSFWEGLTLELDFKEK